MCFVPLLLLAVTLQAPEPRENPYLAPALEQIRRLDERGAMRTLERALAWPENTPENLARAYLYYGLAHANLAEELKAMKRFEAALVLDRSLVLPEWASARVESWWIRAGGRPRPAVDGAPSLPAAGSGSGATRLASPPPSPALDGDWASKSSGEKTPPRPDARGWTRWTGWSLAGAAVALATTGIVFRALAVRGVEKAAETRSVGAAMALDETAHEQGTAANLLFAGAAVAAAGAAGMLVFSF